MKKCIPGLMLVLVGLCSSFVEAEEKAKPPMMKEAMAAKKMMMAPESMAAAKKSMMSEKSMVPGMVAKEMVHQEMMHDKEVMGMVEKGTMTKPSDDMLMLSDKHVAAATEKMLADPNAMQMLFQELVARHIAAQKMEMMMKKKPNAKMATMTGKGMKSMVMDDNAMMMSKKEMMSSEDSAMLMAHESLVHSLMQDEEMMAMVAKEAMMHSDPKMAPMMSDEKMKMADEAMMKDKAAMKGMMNETMVRGMVGGKHKMMMKSEKKN